MIFSAPSIDTPIVMIVRMIIKLLEEYLLLEKILLLKLRRLLSSESEQAWENLTKKLIGKNTKNMKKIVLIQIVI